MYLEPGHIDQDTAGIVLHILWMLRVSADDSLVQCYLLVVGAIGNGHISSLRLYIVEAVQVIDHQFVIPFTRRQILARDALLITVHRVVFVRCLMSLREILPDKVEPPSSVEITTPAFHDSLGGDCSAIGIVTSISTGHD